MITDRFSQPLAISTPVAAIAARPDKLSNSSCLRYCALVDIHADRLRDRVAKSVSPFLYLSRYVTPERANQIEVLGLDGIEVLRQFRRFYPPVRLLLT